MYVHTLTLAQKIIKINCHDMHIYILLEANCNEFMYCC